MRLLTDDFKITYALYPRFEQMANLSTRWQLRFMFTQRQDYKWQIVSTIIEKIEQSK